VADSKQKPIRVVIDATIPARGWGGVQQVAIGLASGFTSIKALDLELLYRCYPDGREWLLPHAPVEALRVVPAPPAPSPAQSWTARNLPAVRRAYHAMAPPVPTPRSDGSLEALVPDIVHFPHQAAFLTSVKSVYQPHDLQHLHLPQFFTRRDRLTREKQYRAFCDQASLVAMATTWGREDILRAYGLPPDKVAVVPLAPVIDRYPALTDSELEKVRADLKLPDQFCFYPAQPWPHKNHEMLLKAVAQLRKRDGLVVPFVFSGARTSYQGHLEGLTRELELSDQVRWVGFVEPGQLRGLYRLARCVVVPTLFESASQPIFEALSSGVAVTCSNVTAAPRQVGDAALIFDPHSTDDIAAAIKRVWTDGRLRQTLVERGRARIAEFSWERTARHFAAHYRRLTGHELSPDDRALLAAEPII
jgi:glycosyltransferase involved in cell wall biosynthesis